MDRVLSSLYLLGLLDYPDFDPRLAPIQEASKHRRTNLCKPVERVVRWHESQQSAIFYL